MNCLIFLVVATKEIYRAKSSTCVVGAEHQAAGRFRLALNRGICNSDAGADVEVVVRAERQGVIAAPPHVRSDVDVAILLDLRMQRGDGDVVGPELILQRRVPDPGRTVRAD